MPSELNSEGIFVKENNEYTFKHIKLLRKAVRTVCLFFY